MPSTIGSPYVSLCDILTSPASNSLSLGIVSKCKSTVPLRAYLGHTGGHSSLDGPLVPPHIGIPIVEILLGRHGRKREIGYSRPLVSIRFFNSHVYEWIAGVEVKVTE